GPSLYICSYFSLRLPIAPLTGIRVAGLEGEGHYAQLILTLGITLVLQNGGLLLFGSEVASIKTPLSASAWEIGPFVGQDVSIFINKARGVAFIVSLLAAYSLYLFVTRTQLGKSLRAAADN